MFWISILIALPSVIISSLQIYDWLKALKADNKLIIHTSARASRAVDYILNRTGAKA